MCSSVKPKKLCFLKNASVSAAVAALVMTQNCTGRLHHAAQSSQVLKIALMSAGMHCAPAQMHIGSYSTLAWHATGSIALLEALITLASLGL